MAYKIFLICAGCGAASGFLYDLLYLVRSLICGMPAKVFTVKDRVAACVCDVIYFVALSALYVFCSVKFSFPDLRLYMIAAVLIGFLVYFNSFHKLTVFLVSLLFRMVRKKT